MRIAIVLVRSYISVHEITENSGNSFEHSLLNQAEVSNYHGYSSNLKRKTWHRIFLIKCSTILEKLFNNFHGKNV